MFEVGVMILYGLLEKSSVEISAEQCKTNTSNVDICWADRGVSKHHLTKGIFSLSQQTWHQTLVVIAPCFVSNKNFPLSEKESKVYLMRCCYEAVVQKAKSPRNRHANEHYEQVIEIPNKCCCRVGCNGYGSNQRRKGDVKAYLKKQSIAVRFHSAE